MSEKRDERGFAGMDDEKQREIASKGGRAAHEQGAAHEFTSDEAREAGRKGGEEVSKDREHMSEIGQKGGESNRGSQGGGSQGGSQGGGGGSQGGQGGRGGSQGGQGGGGSQGGRGGSQSGGSKSGSDR